MTRVRVEKAFTYFRAGPEAVTCSSVFPQDSASQAPLQGWWGKKTMCGQPRHPCEPTNGFPILAEPPRLSGFRPPDGRRQTPGSLRHLKSEPSDPLESSISSDIKNQKLFIAQRETHSKQYGKTATLLHLRAFVYAATLQSWRQVPKGSPGQWLIKPPGEWLSPLSKEAPAGAGIDRHPLTTVHIFCINYISVDLETFVY